MLLMGSDTAEPRETQAGEQSHEAPPAGSGGDRSSLREIPPQVLLRGAPTRWPYPTPVSLGSGPHQRSTTQEALDHRTGATTDASVLQNLRTSTGRNIRLYKRSLNSYDVLSNSCADGARAGFSSVSRVPCSSLIPSLGSI